ncbi:MAG: hypothetical protein IBJ00_06210 [Alphaproteobacteria bacterium]|nr:hypothetical protein [Alphaproteobacteria bacterium]
MRRNVVGLVYCFIIVFIGINHPGLCTDQEDFQPYIKLTIKNIGQGNCNIVKIFDPSISKKPSFMIIDAGTRSYLNEHLSYKYFMERFKQKELEEIEIPLSQPGFLTPVPNVRQEIPLSTMRPLSVIAHKPGKKFTVKKQKGERERLKKEMISGIRRSLGEKGDKEDSTGSLIHVKTIIVSHEDGDHYSLYPDIIKKEDRVDHIILGGVPEKYKQNFRVWLKGQIAKNTEVYFPALSFDPIKNLDAIIMKKGRVYQPHIFAHPKGGFISKFNEEPSIHPFSKALEYGAHIKIHMLSINPTHTEGASGSIIPLNLPDDHNSGSLVVKIQIGESSALLSGDATGTTTTRIIDNYSKVDPSFLKTSLEESSHHGAFTHKSNSKKWIRSTEPTYVVFSSGSLHGHPAEKAYMNYSNVYANNEKTGHLTKG